MVLLCISVLVKAMYIMTAQRGYWMQVADRVKRDSVPVKPTRGNILSSDGRLMASSLPEYKIYMDFKAVKEAKNDSLWHVKLDSISKGLNQIFPSKSAQEFKAYLRRTRAMAIYMETATLFSCGFYNHIPTGALLLVSDNPMEPEGVKTEKSDNHVTRNFAETHVQLGIASLRLLQGDRKTVRHLKFDW